jgi:hypothetical protein
MRVAMACAGFTPSEADQLRRSMATFKHTGGVSKFRDKLISGMIAHGYEREYAQQTFRQLEGFGSYGFPESHAASFALIAYASSWLKCHHPDVFCAALLNAQPMGFYAPAQIVRDARDHGVDVRPVCANASRFDCTLEPTGEEDRFAVRLGLRMVRGLANSGKHLRLLYVAGRRFDVRANIVASKFVDRLIASAWRVRSSQPMKESKPYCRPDPSCPACRRSRHSDQALKARRLPVLRYPIRTRLQVSSSRLSRCINQAQKAVHICRVSSS